MVSLRRLRADAREIFEAGLQSVDPFAAVAKSLQLSKDHLRVGDRTYDLSLIENISVAGCGKAAAPMALALQTSLGSRIRYGVIVVKYGHKLQLENIKVIEAGHPIPDEAGLEGARQVTELARRCSAGDLLFFLVSGGGSSLLPYPAGGLSLLDKQRTTDALLKSGAKIQEVNAVRKHISQIKGGRLTRLAAPARLISLVLSDVIDDCLGAIASGPTAPDRSTYADCLKIIRHYGVRSQIPPAVIEFLQSGVEGLIAETPKPSDGIFQRVQNIIVGNNRTALTAAERRARAIGYHSTVLSSSVEGESRTVAKSHSDLIKEIVRIRRPVSPPLCFLSGGETTVRVRGDGLGGRNQEFCLAAAIGLAGVHGVVILSGGTDGTDGPTDAAGAIVDGSTIARGRAKGLDAGIHLTRNDSYHFLRATDDLLITGPTLTNVMDLQITLVG